MMNQKQNTSGQFCLEPPPHLRLSNSFMNSGCPSRKRKRPPPLTTMKNISRCKKQNCKAPSLETLPAVVVDLIASFLDASDLLNVNQCFDNTNEVWKLACRQKELVTRVIPVELLSNYHELIKHLRKSKDLFSRAEFAFFCSGFSCKNVDFLRTIAILFGKRLKCVVIANYRSKELAFPINPSFAKDTDIEIRNSAHVENVRLHVMPDIFKITRCCKIKSVVAQKCSANLCYADGHSLENLRPGVVLTPFSNKLILRLSDLNSRRMIYTKHVSLEATHAIITGGSCTIGPKVTHVQLEYVNEVRFESPQTVETLFVLWPETQTVGITERLTREFTSCKKYELSLRRCVDFLRLSTVILQYINAVQNAPDTWPSLEETSIRLYMTTTTLKPCCECKSMSVDYAVFFSWNVKTNYVVRVYRICYSGKCHNCLLNLTTKSNTVAYSTLEKTLKTQKY